MGETFAERSRIKKAIQKETPRYLCVELGMLHLISLF